MAFRLSPLLTSRPDKSRWPKPARLPPAVAVPYQIYLKAGASGTPITGKSMSSYSFGAALEWFVAVERLRFVGVALVVPLGQLEGLLHQLVFLVQVMSRRVSSIRKPKGQGRN